MGKTSSPCDMYFYGLEWIGIWANQKMSIYRLYNKYIHCKTENKLDFISKLFLLLCPCCSLFWEIWHSPVQQQCQLTGRFTNRDGPEWTSITGTDLKNHPKLQVLSVLDKKFWLSNIKY